MRKQYRFYDVVMALFVTTLLISNLLSSAKIIDLGLTLGTLRLSFDAGTLIFPISYILATFLPKCTATSEAVALSGLVSLQHFSWRYSSGLLDRCREKRCGWVVLVRMPMTGFLVVLAVWQSPV